MRSGYKALAALCSLAISVNTGCSGGGDCNNISVGGNSAAHALHAGGGECGCTGALRRWGKLLLGRLMEYRRN